MPAGTRSCSDGFLYQDLRGSIGMLDLAHQRQQMIDLQLAARGISNPLVLEAMRRILRERFVAQGLEEFAYEDSPLPIEAGQTISQPYIVAVMIEAAQVQPGDRVLEIGTGSGYAASPALAPREKRQEGEVPRSDGLQRGGWLTDLLSRASRDEPLPATAGRPQPAPAPMPVPTPNAAPKPMPAAAPAAAPVGQVTLASLDTIAVDIARMIDHDAAAELWDRYKRGERNVFTRKLYTMQGQRAFEEIRRKYRGDREFMQTVDRYIAEFERLLEEVSRDDRGQVVARTYLTSETGKVYTMLAHAAGRFD